MVRNAPQIVAIAATTNLLLTKGQFVIVWPFEDITRQ